MLASKAEDGLSVDCVYNNYLMGLGCLCTAQGAGYPDLLDEEMLARRLPPSSCGESLLYDML